MDIKQQIEKLKQELATVEAQLSGGGLTQKELARLSKEHTRLSGLVRAGDEILKADQEIANLKQLLTEETDEEFAAAARGDQAAAETRRQKTEQRFYGMLIDPDPMDDKNIIMEIRAGTGGDEASLFAADLYRMYAMFADRKGWKLEVLSSNPTGLGGFKEIIFQINGDRVFSQLKFERGVHRVQRVPVTEASGRVHTSAITVAVMAEAEEVDLVIADEDLRIDVFRASGAGGQHVNRTESAVRITHVPTGVVVSCQDEKSQLKNKLRAMKILRSRLLEARREEEARKRSLERKTQVGTGDRSEKIRTYNFKENRVSDHRINLTLYNLTDILDGNIDDLLDGMQKAEHREKIRKATGG